MADYFCGGQNLPVGRQSLPIGGLRPSLLPANAAVVFFWRTVRQLMADLIGSTADSGGLGGLFRVCLSLPSSTSFAHSSTSFAYFVCFLHIGFERHSNRTGKIQDQMDLRTSIKKSSKEMNISKKTVSPSGHPWCVEYWSCIKGYYFQGPSPQE